MLAQMVWDVTEQDQGQPRQRKGGTAFLGRKNRRQKYTHTRAQRAQDGDRRDVEKLPRGGLEELKKLKTPKGGKTDIVGYWSLKTSLEHTKPKN